LQTLDAALYEVIVSDDGSPTVEGLIAEKYPWAKWVAGPRRGPAANRNNGAEHATGEWYAFTDDDCIPSREWLYSFWIAANSRNRIDVLEGRTTTGGVVCNVFETAPTNEKGGCLWSCNFAIRSTRFRHLGGFDENYKFAHLEDVDLRQTLAEQGISPVFVTDAIVIHPPRHINSLRKHFRQDGSIIYFAKKHGLTLREVGVNPVSMLRLYKRNWSACRSVKDFFFMTVRNAGLFLIIAFGLPWWLWKYRNVEHKTQV
jgi:GT2 family glycosyltransferase